MATTTPVIPDFRAADESARLASDMLRQRDAFRRFLRIQEGQGASHIPIDEARKYFGWSGDTPLVVPRSVRPRR